MGRRLHKADQKFSQWIKENGFGDIKPATRADAMWLAENWFTVAVDLQNLTIEQKPSVELDVRSAERIAKVINRADFSGHVPVSIRYTFLGTDDRKL